MDIEKKFEFHFATIWEKVSDYVPDDIALVSGENKKNWRDYEQTSAKIASFLKDRGIKKILRLGCIFLIVMNILNHNLRHLKLWGSQLMLTIDINQKS